MPESQPKQKFLHYSRRALCGIFSHLSQGPACSAKTLHNTISEPGSGPGPGSGFEKGLPSQPEPDHCTMLNTRSKRVPGLRKVLSENTNMPDINLAAAIRLDTRLLKSHLIYSKTIEAAESPCLYTVLSYVNTFEYEYNCFETVIKTGKPYNVASVFLAKQVYDTVFTASPHHRTISGSTLVSSPPSISPTSPDFRIEGISFAHGGDSLSEDLNGEEGWDQALQEDCDKRMLALADGVDLAWVPANTNRSFWTQEAKEKNDKYWSDYMVRMAEGNDEERVLLEERLHNMTVPKAPTANSEDTVNLLEKKHADNLAGLEKTMQKEKRTMQAIINDQAKDLDVARRLIAKYEISAKTTVQKGGSLLSDNLEFIEAQKKIRDQILGKENNLAKSTSRSHGQDQVKKRTEQRDHIAESSETQPCARNLPSIGANEEIMKLKTPNDELAYSNIDLISQLETTEVAGSFSFIKGSLPEAQSKSPNIPAATLIHNADYNPKAHTIREETKTGSSSESCHKDNTKASATPATATLSLDINAFADTSDFAFFNTPPPSPPPKPTPKTPQPIGEAPRPISKKLRLADTLISTTSTVPPSPSSLPSPIPRSPYPLPQEPRTRLGKTRAEVAVEVAAALALRAIEEEQESAAHNAAKEKEIAAQNAMKEEEVVKSTSQRTKTRKERGDAISISDARKEGAEKEKGKEKGAVGKKLPALSKASKGRKRR